MKRISNKERMHNARQLNATFDNHAVIVVVKQNSKSNPNICRCRLMSNISRCISDAPKIVAESIDGKMMAFYEFLKAINPEKAEKVLYNGCEYLWERDKLNEYLSKNYHFYISYDDGFAMVLTRV